MNTEYKLVPDYFFPVPADELFCSLTTETAAALAKIKKTKKFPKGEKFFSAGEMPCRIFVLREGEAKMTLHRPPNAPLVRLIEPDEVLGLTQAIANTPYETDAGTVTRCVCEYFEGADFIRFLRSQPSVCFRLVRLLAVNLQKSRNLFFLQ